MDAMEEKNHYENDSKMGNPPISFIVIAIFCDSFSNVYYLYD